MPRETAAERREREAKEAEARYLASRVPATIADVREIQQQVEWTRRDLFRDRERIVELLRDFSRTLGQEADRLVEYPDREPNSSGYVATSSRSYEIDLLCATYSARLRQFNVWVASLERNGVPTTLPPREG